MTRGKRPGPRPALCAALLLTVLACRGDTREGHGSASLDGDPRTAVELPFEAQQAVLHEMRTMLGALGSAMSALAANDTGALQATLATVGMAAAADPALEAMLPEAWKEQAETVHAGFDGLAAAIRRAPDSGGIRDTVLVHLARVTGTCAACHETFRVAVRQVAP